MKKLYRTILGVLLMGGSLVGLAADDNLMRNGNFEAGREDWSSDLKSFEIVPGGVNGDGNCLKMARTERFADWSDTNEAIQKLHFDPPLTGMLKISLYARVENNNEGYPELWVTVFRSDGSIGREEFKLNAGRNWEKKEFVLPRGAAPVTDVAVKVMFRGIGDIFIDDVALTPFVDDSGIAVEQLAVNGGVFGDRGVTVNGVANRLVDYRVAVMDGTKTLAEASGSGRRIQQLFDVPNDRPLTVEVTASEQYGDGRIRQTVTVPAVKDAGYRPYMVWTADSMEKIMPQELPGRGNGVVDGVTVELARNEAEGFQAALRRAPGVELGPVAVEVSPLRREDGKAELPADALSFFQVGYLKLDKLTPHVASSYGEPGWWPDGLLPVEKLLIPDDNTFGVWFNVRTGKETAPGLYHGTVTLRPAGAAAVEIPLTVRVWDFTLPDRPALKTSFDIDWADIRSVYGEECFPEIQRKYIEYVTDHRISPFSLYAREPVDPGLMSGLEERINTIAAAPPLGGNDAAAELAKAAGWKAHLDKVYDSPLADRAYFYGFDEFLGERKDTVREAFGGLKKMYPGIPTLTTSTAVDITPEAMRDLEIDWLCVMFDYYDLEKARKVRAEAPELQVWSYISFQPGYPYANFMLEYPLIESRLIGWQSYQQELDGFLYWGLNQYWQGGCLDETRELVDPADGPYEKWSKRTGKPGQIFDDLYGDGKILLYGKDGPIGSIAFENIRDGMEDYDYLALLQEKIGKTESDELCRQVTTSFTEYTRDPQQVRQVRRAIAAILEEN